MSVAAPLYVRAEPAPHSSRWWALLVTGIAWILASVVVLQADVDSARTIGYLTGGCLIALGVTEFVTIGLTAGWKWLHALLGTCAVVGGAAALTEPFRTYAALASLLALFLVIKGTADVTMALIGRGENDLWWLLLAAGGAEIVLAFWASGYPGRSASLLILWVGIAAFIRGVTQLVVGLQLRSSGEVTGRGGTAR